MKKYLLIILIALGACQEEESNDLSGQYNFIEPPHPISRYNRLDNSQVGFDVIFTIQGSTVTEVDMVIFGTQETGEGAVNDRDIVFNSINGDRITVYGARKSGRTLQASGADFTSANGVTKTFTALQIDPR